MPTRRERAAIEERRAEQKKRQQILLMGGALAVLVLAALAVVASGAFSPFPSQPAAPVAAAPGTVTCSAVQSFPSQGQGHVQPNESHPEYSSNPPTSGWHWDNEQEWGIYTTPQAQEQLVHNLEHGGIIIQYNNLTPEQIQRLTDIVRRDTHHMLLAPYPGLPNDVRVALTAWTRLRTCTDVDESAIQAFVNAFRDKGPERVP